MAAILPGLTRLTRFTEFTEFTEFIDGSCEAEVACVYQDFFKKVQELPVKGESDSSEERTSLGVWIQDSEGLHKDVLLEVVGYGCFKKAVKLESGRVLLIRNVDLGNIDIHNIKLVQEIAAVWQRAVKEEVFMSQLLSKLNLLSPLSREVRVFLAPDAAVSIAAYSSESFDQALRRGVHVIDTNTPKVSTWKYCENRLFSLEEDRRKLEFWDSMVKPLLIDVAQVCKYGVPYLGKDSLNVAIVKISDDPPSYAIRYFGFDFSSKYRVSKLPDGFSKVLSEESAAVHVTRILTLMFGKVLEYEYAPHFSSREYDLQKSLVERYAPQVMALLSASERDHK